MGDVTDATSIIYTVYGFSVNTDYCYLLVWRGITSHACAELMWLVGRCVLSLRCVKEKIPARRGPTQATQQSADSGRRRVGVSRA